MTPYELGKFAAQKQAIAPIVGLAMKALPYAAMIAGPWAFDKLVGGQGADATPTPTGAPGKSPNPMMEGIYAPKGYAAYAAARTKFDPNAQFGGLSPAMGNWMKQQQMAEGMRKHWFRQLHQPRW